jgi:hypothetical protein
MTLISLLILSLLKLSAYNFTKIWKNEHKEINVVTTLAVTFPLKF